jgi:acetyl-CoA C-acetyltransferase
VTVPVHIVSAARTPIGSFLGSLADVTAPRLGAVAIGAALERAKVPPARVSQVFMGNVLSAGVGQAPARQAAVFANVPHAALATTVNKVCGSGLEAVILGARAIAVGDAEIVVAGGMESMSNVPYYLPRARTGLRLGDATVVDGLLYDALRDAYGGFPMGEAAELCAAELGLSRQAQDEVAHESYRRAIFAQKEGFYRAEIAEVELGPNQATVFDDDEPKRYAPDKMPRLRTVFKKDGTITAANASKIDDGAAALVLASERAVKEHDLSPLARIVGWGGAAQAPEWFTTAPSVAIPATLARLGLSLGDIDLFEINEAFAVVTMACFARCGIDKERTNVSGGAIALGHPVGASGARILTTLVHAMIRRDARRGLASLCIGGGEALAMVVQR